MVSGRTVADVDVLLELTAALVDGEEATAHKGIAPHAALPGHIVISTHSSSGVEPTGSGAGAYTSQLLAFEPRSLDRPTTRWPQTKPRPEGAMHEEGEMHCRRRIETDRWRGVSRPVVRAAAVRVSLLGARIPRHERRPLAVNRRAGTPVRRTALPTTHGCLATRPDQADKASQGTRDRCHQRCRLS